VPGAKQPKISRFEAEMAGVCSMLHTRSGSHLPMGKALHTQARAA
jgi:hypothetical protein